MSETYYPFDGGSAVNQAQWTLFARQLLGTGVIKGGLGTDLAVSAPGGVMSVNVASGQGWLQGFFYQNDATKAVAIAASDPSNPRIDRIVVHLDLTAKTIITQRLAGTAAGSPVAPSLTQTSTVWEISLAQIRVNAGVTTITSGNVTDERSYATAIAPTNLASGTTLNGSTIWTQANDGAGSGLDADTVKGYVPANKVGDTFTGEVDISRHMGGANVVYQKFISDDGKTYGWIQENGTNHFSLFNYTDSVLIVGFAPLGATYFQALAFVTGGNVIQSISFFNNSSSGTFSHGLGITPQYVGITDSQSASSMTVGAASYGSSTVVITAGAAHTWKAIAIG